ncbi:alpha/beta fold hydrolase [Aliiroseovarius sp. PTFE2010]|uniref:alpha/beta fold hydrolase n=1 Tax=Aliiroseovarius sp. PTFE2010 TaxID=3417190 RepID=UPI003CE98BAC
MPEPVVFLPGFMSDARLYGPQFAELSAERAVMACPLVGETVEQMAASIVPSLPARFTLIGHSLGGIVAMELLRTVPKRIERLCLMNTNAQNETPHVAAAREPNIIAARAGRIDEAIAQELRRDYLTASPDRGKVVELWHQMGRDLGADRFVAQSRAMQKRPDQQATLRRSKVPTLLICGADDELTPVRRHEFIETLMANARLVVVDGAGHVPTLERPAVVTHALREFLSAPLVLR